MAIQLKIDRVLQGSLIKICHSLNWQNLMEVGVATHNTKRSRPQ